MATMVDPRPRRSPRRDPRLVALAEESGYEIQGRIGAGGMGIVYRGRDADGTDVAIKLLRHEISEDPRARERLAREVAAQQRVRNENIVRILDAELESPDAFVVTEFIPGPTLEDAVHTHGGLHPEAVRELGLVMGETLREIHAAGVVHRDLKPSNVLLRGATEEDLAGFDPDGDRLDPVIIDFGIAIAAEESRLTSTGLVMGTAAYLDPEVVRTNHTGEAGDWWAWAALLAFAATGREPYGGGRADLVFLRAERGEIDVEGAPTELARWLRSALRADPEQRTAPDVLLEQLADLDLTTYDDPGATEAFETGSRTAALPVAEEALPDGGIDPRTERESAAHADQGLGQGRNQDQDEYRDRDPDQEPDQVDAHRAPAAGDTQVLPALVEPTEALPVVEERTEPHRSWSAGQEPSNPTERIEVQGPATEVLPVISTATRQMPVVRPEPAQPPGGGHPGMHPVQRSPYQAAPVPQRASYPQQAPMPQRAAYPQQAAMAQRPMMPPQAPVAQNAPYPSSVVPMHPEGAWAAPVPPAPRRPLLVWIGHLLLIAMAAVAPYVSLAMLLALSTVARTWERSHRALAERHRRGRGGSGAAWAVGLAVPLRVLQALVESVLQVVLPLVLGLLVGIAVDAAWTVLQGTPPPDGIAFAVAMAVTVLITWVGIGSATTRAGAHRTVDAAAPDRVWTAVVAVLLVLLVVAVGTTIAARSGMVDYFPFVTGPRLEDVALWRR